MSKELLDPFVPIEVGCFKMFPGGPSRHPVGPNPVRLKKNLKHFIARIIPKRGRLENGGLKSIYMYDTGTNTILKWTTGVVTSLHAYIFLAQLFFLVRFFLSSFLPFLICFLLFLPPAALKSTAPKIAQPLSSAHSLTSTLFFSSAALSAVCLSVRPSVCLSVCVCAVLPTPKKVCASVQQLGSERARESQALLLLRLGQFEFRRRLSLSLSPPLVEPQSLFFFLLLLLLRLVALTSCSTRAVRLHQIAS